MFVKNFQNCEAKITAHAQDFKPNKKLSLPSGIDFWQNHHFGFAQIQLFIPKNNVAKQKRYDYTHHEHGNYENLFLFFFTHN